MKIQDAVFGIVFVVLLVLKREKWFLYTGLFCFVLAIPLFSRWVFFTAERLTWYGAGFMLIAVLTQMYNLHKVDSVV